MTISFPYKQRLILKALLFLVVFLGFLTSTVAQRDVIVTQAGEEIRCRILDETPTRFVYAYLGQKNKVLRNEIFKNLVTSFKYNYYDADLIKTDKLPGGRRQNSKKAKRVDTRKAKGNTMKADSQPKEAKAKAKNTTDKVKEVLEEEVKSQSKQDDLNSPIEEKVKRNLEEKEKSNKQARKDKRAADKNAKKKLRETKGESSARNGKNPKPEKDTKEPEEKLALDDLENAGIADEKETLKAKAQAEEIPIKLEPSPDTVKSTVEDDISDEVENAFQKAKSGKNQKPKVRERTKIENQDLLLEPEVVNEFKNYLKWRVGAKAGLSNIVNNMIESTNAYDLYREDLMKGWTFGVDAAYFFTEGFGLGAMFTNYKTKNEAEGLTYPNMLTDAIVENGNIETEISNKYVGPVLYFRKGIDFKTFVVLGLSPGMYFYNESGAYNGNQFEFRAQQFGGAATLGLDFLLGNDLVGRDIILSLEAGYNYSRFNEIDYGSDRGIETLSTPLVMDRLDFTIGLRFMRFPNYLKGK